MKPDISYLIGKTAIVKYNTCDHQFKIGTEVTLHDNLGWWGEYDCEVIGVSIANPDNWWYLRLADVEVVEPGIIYTEEEVKELFNKLLLEVVDGNIIIIRDIDNWFEKNKKK